MASKNGFYNVEVYNRQKQHPEATNRIPPRANVLAAAKHIRNMFENKKFLYGVFGGLAMLCLGYRREQPDLHIAYDDKDFHRIKAKLEGDRRIRLPDGMNSLFPAKILVRTGPEYKDEGCTHAAEIALDLVPPGSFGTPSAGMISTNLVLLSLKNDAGKLTTFKGLNLVHLVKTSIYLAGTGGLSWDPRKDVLYLCQHYGADIQGLRNLLDQKATQQNFLGTAFFSRLPPQEQRMCYQVLLGKEPPPIMALTPPVLPAGHKHSASDSSVDPRPRLASHKSASALNTGSQSGLLSPPLPGKNPHKRSVSAEVRPVELSAAPEPHLREAPLDPNGSRDSRSRYRPIHNPSSREASPNGGPPMKPGPNPFQLPSQHVPQIPQNHAHHRVSMLPNLPPNMGPIAGGPHARRSMQNLSSSFHGPVPAYAFGQTPTLNGFAQPGQHLRQPPTGVAEMSATPVNHGQHLKSQVGPAGGPRPQHSGQGPINERPPPHQTRASYQAPPAFVAELSSTPAPGARVEDVHKVNQAGEHNSSKQNTPVELSAAPLKSQIETTVPPAVELEAVSPIGHFIAELSAESATQAITHQTSSTFEDSPVSPPEVHAIPVTVHQDIPIRPLNPRTQSAPLTALPSSLMAGGPKSHPRVPSESNSTPPASVSAEAPFAGTNASRYTQYFSPPQSPPLASKYQAYNPLSPPTLPPQAEQQVSAESAELERSTRPLSFAALKDVDGADLYLKQHRRDKSHDSHASSASHDSRELAEEYRAALPNYGAGYAKST